MVPHFKSKGGMLEKGVSINEIAPKNKVYITSLTFADLLFLQ